MPVAPLLAVALFASPVPALRSPLDVADPGGGAGAPIPIGPAIASVGVGIVAGAVLGFGALVLTSPLPVIAPIAALVLDLGAQWLIPGVFGLPRSIASSAVGMLAGVALGAVGLFVGGAFGRANNPGGGFNDIVFALLGAVVGLAVGPPIVTVLDPFGLSMTPQPVTDAVRDARPVERG